MLEEEEGLKGLLKYVVYPDKGGTWRVQAVPTSSGSFNNRLGLCLYISCVFCTCSVPLYTISDAR